MAVKNGSDLVKEAWREKKMALALEETAEGKGRLLKAFISPRKIFSFDIARIPDDLKNILADKNISKSGFFLKDIGGCLRSRGISLEGIAFDMGVARHLLNLPPGDISLEDFFTEEKKCLEALRGENILRLFREIEMPLIAVLADMEAAGIKVDLKRLARIQKEAAEKMGEIAGEIHRLAGEKFNIDSPRQLGVILFQKLNLPAFKRKKTGFSTDNEVLEILSRAHPLPGKVMEYRELSKLKTTYVDVLPSLVDPRDSRARTSYNQTVTATGRLSSVNPNLQNIPVRSAWGEKLRRAFRAEKDNFLVGADYSQIELRLLAHFSGDRNLLKAFKDGLDIHARTARELFGSEGDKESRRRAKIINFGIIYGMSPYGLAKNLNIEVNEAEDYINRYFAGYPGVKEYMDGVIKDAEKKGFVSTLFGRRRPVPELGGRHKWQREGGRRIAVNTPLQGSASEIIKLAMIRISAKIKENKLSTRLILQVHDELIFEAPEKEVKKAKDIAVKEMEGAVKLSLPLKVNVKTGRSWDEL